MKETLFLSDNNPKIRDQLYFLGYKLCECTLHPFAKWLTLETREDFVVVHGAGIPCKDAKRCKVANPVYCLMHKFMTDLEHSDVHICSSVADLDSHFRNNNKDLALKALKRPMVQCVWCGRKFYSETPHDCNTGFRKRHLKWIKII